MGGGASISSENSAYPSTPGYLSANGARLRRAIVMRAYNLQRRKPKMGAITFEEQFASFAYIKDGSISPVVCVEDVATALQLPPVAYAAWLREVRRGAGAESGGGEEMRTEIEFRRFIDFLETGDLRVLISSNAHIEGLQMPSGRDFSNIFSNGGVEMGLPPPGGTAAASSSSRGEPSTAAAVWQPSSAGGTPRRGMPPTPPRRRHNSEGSRVHRDAFVRSADSSSIYPEVFAALGFVCASDETVVHSLTPSRSQVLVPAGPGAVGTGAGGCPEGTLPPGKPLWRKREVVRSERIVHYTTVDASGLLQELVEKESTETEVLHMECRETGEFAHRETTKYEQLETFNNEVVTEEKGKEEYVHLKSLDDEIEYMESNMPRGRGSGGPPPPEGRSYRGESGGADQGGVPRESAESEVDDEEHRQDYSGHSPPHARKSGPPPHVVPPHTGEHAEKWSEEDGFGPARDDAIPGCSPVGFEYEGSWRPHEAEVRYMNTEVGYTASSTEGPVRHCLYSPSGEEPQSFEGCAPDILGQTFEGLFDDNQRQLTGCDVPLVDVPVGNTTGASEGVGDFTFVDSDVDDGDGNDIVCGNISGVDDGSPTQELRRYGSFDVD